MTEIWHIRITASTVIKKKGRYR